MSRVKGEKSENFCEISFLYAFCDSGAVPGAFPAAFFAVPSAFSIAFSAFLIISRAFPAAFSAFPASFSPNFLRPGLNNFYHLAIFVPKLF